MLIWNQSYGWIQCHCIQSERAMGFQIGKIYSKSDKQSRVDNLGDYVGDESGKSGSLFVGFKEDDSDAPLECSYKIKVDSKYG
ncbi:hypothetical protein CEXT_195011 [Caerostris extrusa]|uniref:Uncharacterized protein n=1 Tax=Caerostris extrusa TaxID=172846 RepID=A0AAV4M7D3_CAEEX|nr:hypothetical protein CEXT_195011 [Caerostris extrusa]